MLQNICIPPFLSFPAITAEDILKNKLAAAAREKLATASKEDQVKAERKRKAAMFAAMLKGAVGGGGGGGGDSMANIPLNGELVHSYFFALCQCISVIVTGMFRMLREIFSCFIGLN